MNITFNELEHIHSKYFSLGYLNTDINTKFALISLICYLTKKIQSKKPEITTYKILKQIEKSEQMDDFLQSLSIICSDFSYGCKEFPTFGIEDKKIPAKIKEILSTWIPF